MPKKRDGPPRAAPSCKPATPPPSSAGQPDADVPVPMSVPDSPQQWYYNDDITDPVNFGFMFPVPKGGQVNASKSSAIPSNPSSNPLGSAAGSSSSGSTKHRISPPLVPRQIPEAAKFVAVSSSDDHHHSSTQYPVIVQPSLASLTASQRQLAQHSLPYRYSPRPDANLSIEPVGQQYVTTLVNERLPHYGPPTTQALRSPSASASWSWSHDYDFTSRNSNVPLPYTTPLLAPEPALHTPSLKRKGTARSPSPASQSPKSDRSHIGTSSRIFSKRRRPGQAQSPQHLYHAIDTSLCVRCQIYNKAYTGAGLCESCIQATNFTSWPSLRGTRRENMESLVLYLLPAHMEDCIRLMSPNIPQSRTWRILSTPPPEQEYDFSALVFQDQYVLVKEQVRSTGLFSEDFGDLADIARKYQRSLQTPNMALENCCVLLSACCELYKSFVAVAKPKNTPPKPIDIQATIENIQNARTLMFQGFRELQEMALSSSDTRDRETWLPSFLCACWMTVAAVIFLDILIACPSPWKEQIWGQGWHNRISEIRYGGYGMLVHVLQANTKGINPLKLNIWADGISQSSEYDAIEPALAPYQPTTASLTMSTGYAQQQTRPEPQTQIQPRGYLSWPLPSENPWIGSHGIESRAQRDREVLLGAHSPAALQGLMSLKAWQKRYDDHLKMGEDMFSKDLYSLALMKPVAGLWRVFEMK